MNFRQSFYNTVTHVYFVADLIYGYPGLSVCEVHNGHLPIPLSVSQLQDFLAATNFTNELITIKYFLSTEKLRPFNMLIQGKNLRCGSGMLTFSANRDGYERICRATLAGYGRCAYRCPCQEICTYVWISIVHPAAGEITYIWNWTCRNTWL